MQNFKIAKHFYNVFAEKKYTIKFGLILYLLTVLPFQILAQTKPLINSTLKGKVVDAATKGPLPGALVQIEGVTNQAQTNNNGEFTLVTGQKFPYNIIVSYIGYEKSVIRVDGSPITISLKEAVNQLSDVVVVGYGTQRKQDLTGSITKVSASDINKIPVASFDAQLQGKASGVQVLTNSGVPGEGIFLRVRGTTSINSSSDPLYIVDGVFLNNTSLQNISLAGRVTSPLADINPGDIESIEVLKDAAATAIYGSRGANGVVIITTKQGNYDSKSKVDFNVSSGWVEADKSLLPPLATGPEVAALANEWWINSGIDNPSLNQTFANRPFRPVSEGGRGTPEETPTYDRLGYLLRKGHVQDYNLGISGGGKESRYYLGAGYTEQEAYLKVLEFRRASLKFNFDHKLSNSVKIGITNSFSRSYRNQARTGDGPQVQLYNSAIATAVYAPIFTEEGVASGADNTYTLVDNYDINTVSLRYVGSVFAEIDFTKNLKFRSSFSADYNQYNEAQYWNTNTSIGSAQGGQATEGISRNGTWINEQTLTYQKNFNKHRVTALVGNTLQSNELSYLYAEGNGFANNDYQLISSAATRTSTENWSKYTIASFFGRLGYNYDNRYFAEATLRADGSSKFGANNKWGYFPAFSLAWKLKEENFLKNVSWLDELKLRASYGVTGNQAGINNFASRGLWSGGSGYADVLGTSQPGIAPQQLGNDDLRWERTAQTNLGLDFSVFNNRLSVTFDLYNKYTSDLLLQQPIAASTGFSQVWANVGEVSNKGYELTVNSTNIKKGNFSWNTSLNVSGNQNKVEKLPAQISFYSRDWIVAREGYSLNSFWLYEQLSIDPQTGAPVFDGQLPNGTLPIEARKILDNAYPKLYGGINNTFTYKQFDLGTDFSFQYGNYSLNLYRYFRERNPSTGGIFKNLLNRWQKPGDITDVPRLTASGLNYTLDQNSRYLEDASFLKLRQVTFGYTLPKSVLSKTGISKARVYFVGANLFVWSKYGGDPESTVSGNPNAQGLGSFGTPPQPRSFQFGLNVTL